MNPSAKLREPLSVKLICDAAIELIERDGLEKLSMRTLAKGLGVDPMAIYHHIPNKASLLNNVYESVLADLFTSNRTDSSWQENLNHLVVRFRKLASRYPRLFPSLITSSHEIDGMSKTIDIIYGLLLEAGLDTTTTLRVSDTLFAFVTGFILLEVTSQPPNTSLFIQNNLHNSQRMEDELQNNPFSSSFEFGLQLIIAGIEEYVTAAINKRTLTAKSE